MPSQDWLSLPGMLAGDGRCKTLDAAADGYVRAEACILLLLQFVSAAEAPAAILAGSSVNQARVLRLQRMPKSGVASRLYCCHHMHCKSLPRMHLSACVQVVEAQKRSEAKKCTAALQKPPTNASVFMRAGCRGTEAAWAKESTAALQKPPTNASVFMRAGCRGTEAAWAKESTAALQKPPTNVSVFMRAGCRGTEAAWAKESTAALQKPPTNASVFMRAGCRGTEAV